MAYIYTNPYKQPYLSAQQELEQRLKELAAIQQRVSWLQATISALEPLANSDAIPPPKFGNVSDICCAVLAENPGRPMLVPEMIHVIGLMGVKLNYSDSLSVIHTTLKRLASKPSSPVILVPPTKECGPGYFWDPTYRLLREPYRF